MREENSTVKVSVIVPVYNTEEYLEQCLDSCVNQTLDAVDIIVVNDGSTDGSLRMIEKYADRYANITVMSIANSGLSVARNTGLEAAKGKYVYFCDSDDWMEPDCLEQAFSYAEKYNLEIVTFDIHVSYEGDFAKVNYNRFDKVDASCLYTGREFVEKSRACEHVTAWMYFVKRDFLERNTISFLPEAIYEDNKFYLDCMCRASRVRYLPHELYHYRIRKHSIMTSGITLKKLSSPFKLCTGMVETIESLCAGTETKLFWMAYISRKIGALVHGSWMNAGGEETQKLLETYYETIENLQYEFLCRYWNVLEKMQPNPKSVAVMLGCMENALCLPGILSDRIEKMVREVYGYRERYMYDELKKLPFSEEGKKIGIYGTGNHTWGLLKNYQAYIGEIKCRIIYINSNTVSYTERIKGVDVINISEAATVGLDGILVSSFLHEQEMLEMAKSVAGDHVPVYTIYDGKKYWLDTEPKTEGKIRERLLSFRRDLHEKRIYLLAVPKHTNTGDYLILAAERAYLKKYFANYNIIELSGPDFRNNRDNVLVQITRQDILLITGGGFFGSLWPDGETIKKALEWFPDNKIVVLPQSLFFEDGSYGNKMQEEISGLVRQHRNLTICYREHISLERGRKIFGETISQYVFPDMALFLKVWKESGKREKILICLRNDAEGVLTEKEKTQIEEIAGETGNPVAKTSMHWEHPFKAEEADEILRRKLDEIASARLVITDALHCVLSCVLTRTPCIALPSRTGKTEGIYQWIKKEAYIKYISIERSDDFMEIVEREIREMAVGKYEADRSEITGNLNGSVCDVDFRVYEEKLAALIDGRGI